ncbi:hypothetical protein VE26_04970 [Devosia chinhatensis]|uniref:Aminoglycoside phosphotransferase domain-containing protein n=1 Tax=Devosia chinhatensis TaxID=429727 RepID=A0A0F5FNX9_9HYPH|nr:hypothetical protein VE26_04970 [Devosia chinhatensis]
MLWPELTGAVPRLINYSENHTFLLAAPGGAAYTLRVHRPDYQDSASIDSELAWLGALHRDTDLPVPLAVPGRDGRLIQQVTTHDGLSRHAVLFRFIEGAEPSPSDDLVGLFGVLGEYAARLHAHAADWTRPSGFMRQAWNAKSILDANGLWGDWRVAPGVTPAIRIILDRSSDQLQARLGRYGMAPNRYGLIHADMRLGNILVDGSRVSLIDFDDCGLCWFTYDFAAAISFYETSKTVPELKAAWLDQYCAHRALDPQDIAEIDSMILLRRMALLAWIGSHAETDLAQTHQAGFAEGTADLAERYLAGAIWP